MYKIFKNFFLLAAAVIATVLLQYGCKKKDVYPAQTLPAISSVTPAKGIIGSTVVIKGVNLKNVTDVKFGAKDAANFVASANTDTSITVNVPDSLAPGDLYVQVYFDNGKGYNAAAFTVLKTPPVPHITSVAPATGFPGDQVTIKGVNLDIVSNVLFGGIAATSVTIVDSSKLQVNVPANAAGGDQWITLQSVNGSDSVKFNVNLAPVITSVSPENVKEGDAVTVKGVRFTGTTSVTLGPTSLTFNLVDDATITFTVPTGAATGKITVTTPNGSGTSADNIVVAVPGVKLVIYDDVIQGGFSKWGGWGGDADENNTSPVESGTKSVKIHYVGGYGSPLQLGGATIDLTKYTTFKISVYGGPGTAGKSINIGFNSANDPTNYNTTDGKTITIKEGQWTDFEIPIADITSSTGITILDQIILKEYSGISGDETIYVDNIGLN